jgi:hypothetical protein
MRPSKWLRESNHGIMVNQTGIAAKSDVIKRDSVARWEAEPRVPEAYLMPRIIGFLGYVRSRPHTPLESSSIGPAARSA